MPENIFRDPTTVLPKSDRQLIVVPLDRAQLAGTPAAPQKAPALPIKHVPNSGSLR